MDNGLAKKQNASTEESAQVVVPTDIGMVNRPPADVLLQQFLEQNNIEISLQPLIARQMDGGMAILIEFNKTLVAKYKDEKPPIA